jgi:hypothetical protein
MSSACCPFVLAKTEVSHWQDMQCGYEETRRLISPHMQYPLYSIERPISAKALQWARCTLEV